MPYPTQTNSESIIKMAQELIEQEGSEQLSLARLASKLGIKPPSLYRYIPNKATLLQAVNNFTFQQLFQSYEEAMRLSDGNAKQKLMAISRTHRLFALTNPKTYILAFTTTRSEQSDDAQMLEQLVLPIQKLIATIVGLDNSLSALRGALAIVHGFVMLEINDQFKRGGDLSEAFEVSVNAYLSGWEI